MTRDGDDAPFHVDRPDTMSSDEFLRASLRSRWDDDALRSQFLV